jgi:cysteine desulfuration protein SufE
MESIAESEKNIIEDFEIFEGDWSQIYEQIIDEGKKLPPLDAQYQTDLFKIKGCQSSVWLHTTYTGTVVQFAASSDSVFVKGLISLLIRVLNNRSPQEIINAKLTFIDKIGLRQHMAQTRTNGLAAMIDTMKTAAKTYINI